MTDGMGGKILRLEEVADSKSSAGLVGLPCHMRGIMSDETEDRRDFRSGWASRRALSPPRVRRSAADMAVTKKDVDIKTPDGTCDAAFIHPTTGSHPGGSSGPTLRLRPCCARWAATAREEGYSVLVPNPFYRVARSRFSTSRSSTSATGRAREADAADGIDQRRRRGRKGRAGLRRVARSAEGSEQAKKIGTQGYCMGGPLVMRTAARCPARIGAGGRSMAAGSSRTTPTARICSRRRLTRACTSASRRTTTSSSPMRRQAEGGVRRRPRCRPRSRSIPRSTAGAFPTCRQAGRRRRFTTRRDADRAWGNLLALYKTALA